MVCAFVSYNIVVVRLASSRGFDFIFVYVVKTLEKTPETNSQFGKTQYP